MQADEFLDLSTTLVAPTSTGARPTSFRPAINIDGTDTRVLVEQTVVVDPQRLGPSAGRLDADEQRAVDEGLALVLGLPHWVTVNSPTTLIYRYGEAAKQTSRDVEQRRA